MLITRNGISDMRIKTILQTIDRDLPYNEGSLLIF